MFNFDDGSDSLSDLINGWLSDSGFSDLLAQAAETAASEDPFTPYTAKLEKLTDTVSALKAAYDALDAAQADMATGAGLSTDTIEALASANDDYLSYLYEENGVINAVLLQFERPANQGQSVQEKRASYGQAYYDKFAGKIQINTPEQEGGCKLKIVDNLTTVNFRSGNMTPKYIVIHYFGALGTAKSVSEYFKTPGIQASAHYALDEGDTIYRCVRDKDIAWHCGANKYKHPECRNSNSIGIEARPSKINRKRVMASDTDWYFEPKVVDNLVWLTKKLMAQYNIPADHVIRHYDVTGKLCPRPWCCADMNVYYRTSGDAQWEEFKKRISDGKEEDEDMTLDTFKELMKEYRAELQDNDCGTWSKEAREWAISNGLINGTGTEVNGEPNYAWADQLTREQAAALFYRFAKLMGKA